MAGQFSPEGRARFRQASHTHREFAPVNGGQLTSATLDAASTLGGVSGTSLASAFGAWTSYTPTLGGTGWAIGNGTVGGYYCRVGKTVQFRFRVTFGTTSTYGAAASPTISLPATPRSDWDIFPVQAIDGSAALMVPVFARYVTSALALSKHDGTGLTATVPFMWASTDVLRGGGTYEAV